ncbi:ABC transporter [Babesia ovata]|uniref:ABC transporter n=1 Tax=Babesia ovata TaxID=189622 RepID=A0A2H6KE30_9APIC|nr:ABC transporter [Babesia ovata]GBE61251.1 ABC transporter [Babesia ovata]
MSYGWLSESTLAPRKARSLQVPKGSVSVLKRIISKHTSDGSASAPAAKSRRKKDPFADKNPGVELRNQVDRVGQSTSSARVRERLEAKARIYESLAEGRESEVPEGLEVLVNFQSKRELDSASCTVQGPEGVTLLQKAPEAPVVSDSENVVNEESLDTVRYVNLCTFDIAKGFLRRRVAALPRARAQATSGRTSSVARSTPYRSGCWISYRAMARDRLLLSDVVEGVPATWYRSTFSAYVPTRREVETGARSIPTQVVHPDGSFSVGLDVESVGPQKHGASQPQNGTVPVLSAANICRDRGRRGLFASCLRLRARSTQAGRGAGTSSDSALLHDIHDNGALARTVRSAFPGRHREDHHAAMALLVFDIRRDCADRRALVLRILRAAEHQHDAAGLHFGRAAATHRERVFGVVGVRARVNAGAHQLLVGQVRASDVRHPKLLSGFGSLLSQPMEIV